MGQKDKLSQEDILGIVEDYNNRMSGAALAKKYGVIRSTIKYHLTLQDEQNPGSVHWRWKKKRNRSKGGGQ